MDRRDFLKTAGANLARVSGLLAANYVWQSSLNPAGAANPPQAQARSAAKGPGLKYKLSKWTGDDFTLGHRMRSGDGPTPPKHAESKVDFIIVGGGIAALAAAYELRDHNFLLLEQYADFGGTAKGGQHNGLWYSMGAAYYSDSEGPVAEYADKFGLKPAILGPEKNSFYFENDWVNGVEGLSANLLYRNFKKLRSDLANVNKRMHVVEPSLPVTQDELLKLDGVSFASILTGYDAPFRTFVDRILMSSACADASRTNALAGTILANDFFNKSYVLQGGNPAMGRALAAHIEPSGKASNRMRKSCFVWSVEIKDEGASVSFSDKDGHMHKVDCKHVIMATPPLVTGRILSGVKNTAKASLFWFRYGSYLVANVICKKRVFKGTYDNFVPPPFEFTDFTVAETPYLKNNTYKPEMQSVLTIYNPWQPGTMGRAVLTEGNRAKLASELVSAMGNLIPDLENNIEEIILTRWGHAINICQLNYYDRISKINASFGDSYTLAHSSLQGIQCIESAVAAGQMAASRALKTKAGKAGAR